ncbi:MAG: cytochrome c biogenesis protein ResB [Desulfomonilaceae bacterium]
MIQTTETINSKSSQRNSIASEVTTFFTSVRTAIGLLFLLAAASVLGTLIPQDMPLEQLQQTISPFYFRLITILDLHKLYSSWWFIILLLVLSLNILGCLLQRLRHIPSDWKIDSGKSNFSFSFTDNRPQRELQTIIASELKQVVRGAPRIVKSKDGVSLSWVNDRIQLLGFPFIHTAIILILIGGLIGSVYGIKGKVNIKEGDKTNRFTRIPTGAAAQLPFEIAVDKFILSRYRTGEPKEYRSDVRLLVDGNEVLKDSILVNHPLTFQGISLYQSDYRLTGIKDVKLGVVNQSGQSSEIILQPGLPNRLEGTQYEFRLISVDFGSAKRGPGVEIQMQGPDGQSRTIKIFRNDPKPVGIDDLQLSFLDYVPVYATGLQIGYDPGSVVVWIGCILLISGFFLSLFTNFRNVGVRLTRVDSGCLIEISGRSKRLRKEFRERVKKSVEAHLQNNIKVAPVK